MTAFFLKWHHLHESQGQSSPFILFVLIMATFQANSLISDTSLLIGADTGNRIISQINGDNVDACSTSMYDSSGNTLKANTQFIVLNSDFTNPHANVNPKIQCGMNDASGNYSIAKLESTYIGRPGEVHKPHSSTLIEDGIDGIINQAKLNANGLEFKYLSDTASFKYGLGLDSDGICNLVLNDPSGGSLVLNSTGPSGKYLDLTKSDDPYNSFYVSSTLNEQSGQVELLTSYNGVDITPSVNLSSANKTTVLGLSSLQFNDGDNNSVIQQDTYGNLIINSTRNVMIKGFKRSKQAIELSSSGTIFFDVAFPVNFTPSVVLTQFGTEPPTSMSVTQYIESDGAITGFTWASSSPITQFNYIAF